MSYVKFFLLISCVNELLIGVHFYVTVQWRSQHAPVVFGETYSLICDIENTMNHWLIFNFVIWRSYNNDRMLCSNGKCFSDKYKMIRKTNLKEVSILEIKTFTELDVREYTCSRNFLSFTKNIEVFEYMSKYGHYICNMFFLSFFTYITFQSIMEFRHTCLLHYHSLGFRVHNKETSISKTRCKFLSALLAKFTNATMFVLSELL